MHTCCLRTCFFILVMTVCLIPTSAQTKSKRPVKTDAEKYRIHPTRLRSSPTGVYIPKDLPDTFTELDKMLSPALRAEMRQGNESGMIRYHFGLGMWIRNNWGLWKGLRLAKWFTGYTIHVPDDMSGMILTSYWRYLHHQPIAFDAQVKATLAYWESAKIAETKEKERVLATKDRMRTMMMGLQVAGAAKHVATFPSKPLDNVRVRYMAPFAGGILLTAKTFDAKPTVEDFSCQCYFLNLTTTALHPVRLAEMDRVLEGIVIDDHAYFHGLQQGRDVLLDIHGNERKLLPVPPENGLLQLGIEHPGTTESHLLAVRPHTVSRWSGQWELLYRTKERLPYGVFPPQQLGSRLYFRDEGRNEDNKRLSWLDRSVRDTPFYFDEHVGVVGPEGPRWENVWSYAATPNGALWLTTGSIIGSLSLLKWNGGREGYRIALFNDAATFSGELLGEDFQKDTPLHALALTGLEAMPDNSIHAIGPHGLFSIDDQHLTPLLRFRNAPHEWIPTHLLTLNASAFLTGGHFGGIYLFRKAANGDYNVSSPEKKQGAPKAF